MRILLLQTSFLGDVALSTPVIAGLRRQFPDAEIWMFTTPQARALVARDPELAGVLTFDKNNSERSPVALVRKALELRKIGFDRAYALQRSARSSLLLWLARIPVRIGFQEARFSFLYTEKRTRDKSKHDVLRNLEILGFSEKEIEALPRGLRIKPPVESEISPLIREALGPDRSTVVLVPGSVWRTKMWDWRGYRDVARRFAAAEKRVVLVGSSAERALTERVAGNLPVTNLAGRTTLEELIWIISRAAVVVCNDSLALHLASAAKTPAVALFCATSPSFGFGPWENAATVLEVDGLACKPCSRHGTASCPTGTWACMRELQPERVFAAAQDLMRSWRAA